MEWYTYTCFGAAFWYHYTHRLVCGC
jgi:hypothetical protein